MHVHAGMQRQQVVQTNTPAGNVNADEQLLLLLTCICVHKRNNKSCCMQCVTIGCAAYKRVVHTLVYPLLTGGLIFLDGPASGAGLLGPCIRYCGISTF